MPDRWSIRPFVPGDLQAVADLYEALIRNGETRAPAGLVAAFRSLFIDSPVAANQVPCLVIDSAAGIAGFQGVQVRNVPDTGLVASLGPLFVAPALRAQAAGVRLMKAMLDGPQALSYSDGASEEARRLWEHIGGHCSLALSLEWTIPLLPAATQVDRLGHQAGRALKLAAAILKPAARMIDPILATRWQRKLDIVAGQAAGLRFLSPDDWVDVLQTIGSGAHFEPDRSQAILRWTLAQMDALSIRGRLLRLSAERAGRIIGAMLGYHTPDGRLLIMYLAYEPKQIKAVISAVLIHALELGCKSVSGRCDGTVQGILGDYPVMYQRSTPVLVHSREPALIDRFCGAQSRFSRIDGEWLMNLREQVYS